MMKRFQAVLFAMLAVFAFGAIMAATASAEETLLAEWLVNGAAISELLSVEILGTLLLEDEKTIAGKAAVDCTAILDGSIGPNGEDETTEVLNLAGTIKFGELGGTALLGTGAGGPDCRAVTGCSEGTTASPIEVWPLGLPWLTELYLMVTTNEILDLITSMNAADGELVGYEILCLILGLNAEDTCTAAKFDIQVVNEEPSGDAETPASSQSSPKAECSQGGALSGVNETTELSEIMPLNPATELITVSSEEFGR